jgi:hypothetical protein
MSKKHHVSPVKMMSYGLVGFLLGFPAPVLAYTFLV